MMRSYATWMLVMLTLMTTVVVNAEDTHGQGVDLAEVTVAGSLEQCVSHHTKCVSDHNAQVASHNKLAMEAQELAFQKQTAEANTARCQTDLDNVNWNNTVVLTALVAMIIVTVFVWYKHITQVGPTIQNNNFVSTTTPNAEHDQKIAKMQDEMDAMRDELSCKTAIIPDRWAVIESMAKATEMNKKQIGDLNNEIHVYKITIADMKRHHKSDKDRMMALELQNNSNSADSATLIAANNATEAEIEQLRRKVDSSQVHVDQLRHTQRLKEQEFAAHIGQLEQSLEHANNQVKQLQHEVYCRDSMLVEERSLREMHLSQDRSDHRQDNRQDNRQVNVFSDNRQLIVIGAAAGEVNKPTSVPVQSDSRADQYVAAPQANLLELDTPTSSSMMPSSVSDWHSHRNRMVLGD
jgi:hypothetical protein